jgi:hypothetical protein
MSTGTVTEYAFRYTTLTSRGRVTRTSKPHRSLALALMSIEEQREEQRHNPRLYPEIDAHLVERTVTYTTWRTVEAGEIQ